MYLPRTVTVRLSDGRDVSVTHWYAATWDELEAEPQIRPGAPAPEPDYYIAGRRVTREEVLAVIDQGVPGADR